MDTKIFELRDLQIGGEHYADGNHVYSLEAEIDGLLHEKD